MENNTIKRVAEVSISLPSTEKLFKILISRKNRLEWKQKVISTSNDPHRVVIDYFGYMPHHSKHTFVIRVLSNVENNPNVAESNTSLTIFAIFGGKQVEIKKINVKTNQVAEYLKKSYSIIADPIMFLGAYTSDKEAIGTLPDGRNYYDHVRLTKRRDYDGPAMALEYYIADAVEKPILKNEAQYTLYQSHYTFEVPPGYENPFRNMKAVIVINDKEYSYITATHMMEDFIERAKANKSYVTEENIDYIPQGANIQTWDFDLNMPLGKGPIKKPQMTQTEPDGTETKDDDKSLGDFDIFANTLNRQRGWYQKFSQDFSHYFQGEVPEYIGHLVGSPSVDVSSLASFFPNIGYVISLVNQFDGALLRNISFIFNSADSGSFGVYVPALDRQVKEKALKAMLEQRGYKVIDIEGVPTAFPSDERKKPTDVEKEIQGLYDNLEREGGTIFGVNIEKDIQAGKDSAASIGRPDLWEVFAAIHIGGTMVHEATHAKGHMEESTPEQVEASFMRWAINKLQSERTIDVEGEIVMKPASNSPKTSWYKKAQFLGNPSFGRIPVGSDLMGRMGPQLRPGMMQGWSMLGHQQSTEPIESRLGRQYMWPLPPDLSQENDITELQLRKNTRDMPQHEAEITMEELLSESHTDDSQPYRTIEQQLEENRVSPLMVTIKSASSMTKLATLFGWMNNLEISDGHTIPGLSDRVMAWSDRDDSFVKEEDWIKGQPRYNPTYDFEGFYYRWIEPRFAPRLFTDITEDVVNTHPAKRFAQVNIDSQSMKMMSVLSYVRDRMSGGNFKGTRFMASEDVVPVIEKVFEKYRVTKIPVKNDDDVMAIWVYTKDISEKDILEAEQSIMENGEIPPEFVIGGNKQKTILEILRAAKEVSHQFNLADLYVVGESAAAIMRERDIEAVNEIDFCISSSDSGVKAAKRMADLLNVEHVYVDPKNKSVRFQFNGVMVDFSGKFVPEAITELLKERNIEPCDRIESEMYNRDLNVNMMAVRVPDGQVRRIEEEYEPIYIDTFFDPDKILDLNPLIGLRAILLSIQMGMPIAERLEKAIMKRSLSLEKNPKYHEGVGFMKKRILQFGGEELLQHYMFL